MPDERKEQTFAQTVYSTQTPIDERRAILDKRLPATYETYRLMRRQPTVAFARALCIAPVVSSEWSIEADEDVPPERVEFIRSQVMPMRDPFLMHAMQYGNVDYGWTAYEKVFGVEQFHGEQRTVIKRLKPLLVDLTDILVERGTGKFAGFRQPLPTDYPPGYKPEGVEILVNRPYALLINFRVEGDEHYGEPLLENIRQAYSNWLDANEGAERYDKKLAGAQWVVHYPDGSNIVDGTEQSNDEIARWIVDQLEASASIIVPRKISKFVTDLNQALIADEWMIELKDHAAKQGSFIERMNYCDKLYMRGLLIPERAALEGLYGTKADAGTHTDLALTIREIEHSQVTRQFQWHVVDQLLAINYGHDARGTVRVEPSPLVDEKLAFFRQLYMIVLGHPTASLEAMDALDIDALMDAVGVPKKESVAYGEDEPEVDFRRALAGQLQRLMDTARQHNGEREPIPAEVGGNGNASGPSI